MFNRSKWYKAWAKKNRSKILEYSRQYRLRQKREARRTASA